MSVFGAASLPSVKNPKSESLLVFLSSLLLSQQFRSPWVLCEWGFFVRATKRVSHLARGVVQVLRLVLEVVVVSEVQVEHRPAVSHSVEAMTMGTWRRRR